MHPQRAVLSIRNESLSTKSDGTNNADGQACGESLRRGVAHALGMDTRGLVWAR